MNPSPSSSRPTSPEPPGYVNPLESSSRWYLNARATTIRYAASLGFSLANRYDPPAPAPTTDFYLDSTLSAEKGKGKIKVDMFVPPKIPTGPRTAVINFHGGGWILGQGTDDSRWAMAVMAQLDAVVFSVNYRLAPSYPYPVAIEDAVDSINQIVARAEEFRIDPHKILLSGFSAGATTALASWIVLHDPSRWDYVLPSPRPHIAGIALFYPVLDWTISRPEKRLTCVRPDLTLPKGLTDLIDASYVYPTIDRAQRTNPRLSPGLMEDYLLAKLPPIHLCLCEYDMLLAEGMRFFKRLEENKKPVTLRVVEGEKHAWDNPLPMAPKDSVAVEYGEAVQAMANWLGQDCESDSQSMRSMRSMRSKRPTLKRPKYLSFRSKSSR